MKKRILILSCMTASLFGACSLPLAGIGYEKLYVSAEETDDVEEQILTDEEVQEILNSAQEVTDDEITDEEEETDDEDADDEDADDEDSDDEDSDDEDAAAEEYANSISDDDIISYSQQNLDVLMSMDLTSYDPETSSDAAYVNDWYYLKDEVGEYISTDESTVLRDGRKVSGVLTTTCENATVQFTVTFDAYDGLESITAVNLTKQEEESTTLGQSMANAGINTLVGMGTVFVMLIIIAYIISLFKYIPKVMDKFQRKPKEIESSEPLPVPVKPIPAPAPVVEEDLSDDEELVAVISAAIAAYEGETGTDGFVVRSIRRH